VREYVSTWVRVAAQTMAADQAQASALVRAAAVQLGSGIVRGYSKGHHKEIRGALVGAVWLAIQGTARGYVDAVVNGDDDDAEYDTDGEQVGVAPLVCALLEFVCEAAGPRAYRKDIREGLPRLLENLLAYMQLPDDTLDAWAADPNRFLADDEDDTMTYTVRSVCADVLVCMPCDALTGRQRGGRACTNASHRYILGNGRMQHAVGEESGPQLVAAVFGAARGCLEACEARRQAGDATWWKGSEAALYAVGQISECCGEPGDARAAGIDALAQAVYDHYLRADAPYLQGRALWLAGRYSDALSPGVLKGYVDAAAQALAPSLPMPVQVLAMRALHKLLAEDTPHARPACIPHLPAVYTHIAAVLPAATDDVLALTLDLCIVALEADKQAAAQAEPVLAPLVIDAWLRHANDPVVVVAVQEVVHVLAQTPAAPALLARALVPIGAVLRADQGSDTFGIQASAIDILATLVRACPANAPLPAPLLGDAYPALMHVLATTDDAAALQNGCECLSVFLAVGAEQLVAGGAVEGIIQFVARILSLGSEESAIFVGRLVTKLVRKVHLGAVLEPLLTACLDKLGTAKYLLYQQTLVTVFAHLLRLDYPYTMDFLTRQPGMHAWMHGHRSLGVTAFCALVSPRNAMPCHAIMSSWWCRGPRDADDGVGGQPAGL
jgi:hypothetical protein